MRRICQHAVTTLVGLLACLTGCDNAGLDRAALPKVVVPPGVAGTVSQYAALVGGNEMPVKGYGIVVGLGQNGSAEIPDAIRKYLFQEMLKKGIASSSAGTGALTPTRMLKDKDTAVVVVSGRLPPAAPVGTKFDLYVESPPRTQTVSLDGGYLLPVDLRFALPASMVQFSKSRPWADGKGEVFVNPFVAREKSGDHAAVRRGTIPNGGVVTRNKPIRLELRRPDVRMSHLIQRRLGQRFGGDEKVAIAKTPSLVELRIPRKWRNDYVHFLRLVMHVYLPGGAGADEQHARELARDILLPTARREDIALVWEAMGRPVLTVIRQLYTSDNPAAAFYAARTGLRLGDAMAVDSLLVLAQQANSPVQIPAVAELGRTKQFVQQAPTLRRMLSSQNELLRVAAYEALLKLGSITNIRRRGVSEHFVLDIVDTQRDYVVYATQTGQPKIVLFGRSMPIREPLFFSPGDELVTIVDTAGKAAGSSSKPIGISLTDSGTEISEENEDANKTIMVFRRLPRGNRKSPPLNIAPLVEELIATLGRRPERGADGKVEGLGLTYCQVVGVLQGMCKAGHIPAKFVLQRAPAVQRIYSSATGIGRPDMPEESR